jgi:hypothetical protein
MTNELKTTIENFLVNFKNNVDDPDLDLWELCWGAIDLLEQIVENK